MNPLALFGGRAGAVVAIQRWQKAPVAWAMARWRWRRTRAAVAIGGLALACGVPVALGYGMLAPA